ncbi:hypothetical protein SDC9_200453 [bioreactor metagenome]|uniref:Uncharacterized protein n=1 Tax=bioreactor metagenome TaxID=1076179 RepID=A0A645INV5_9ZZZZ
MLGQPLAFAELCPDQVDVAALIEIGQHQPDRQQAQGDDADPPAQHPLAAGSQRLVAEAQDVAPFDRLADRREEGLGEGTKGRRLVGFVELYQIDRLVGGHQIDRGTEPHAAQLSAPHRRGVHDHRLDELQQR